MPSIPDYPAGTLTADALFYVLIDGRSYRVTASDIEALFDFGSAAYLDVGTGASNIVQLDGSGRLPAVDGSQLLNLPNSGEEGGPVTDDTKVPIEAQSIAYQASLEAYVRTAGGLARRTAIGSAAARDIGTAEGDVPELDANGLVALARLPDVALAAEAARWQVLTGQSGNIAPDALGQSNILVVATGNVVLDTIVNASSGAASGFFTFQQGGVGGFTFGVNAANITLIGTSTTVAQPPDARTRFAWAYEPAGGSVTAKIVLVRAG